MASTATITDLVKATANVASVGYDIIMQAARFMESMQKSSESGQSKKDSLEHCDGSQVIELMKGG